MKKLLVVSLFLLAVGCTTQQTIPAEKMYTLGEVKQILSQPELRHFYKKETGPCFYKFGLGWREFDTTIVFDVPTSLTCKGDTF